MRSVGSSWTSFCSATAELVVVRLGGGRDSDAVHGVAVVDDGHTDW